MQIPEKDDVLPTFRDNRDRAVYLAGEYKYPLTVMALAAGVWVLAFEPSLPIPTDGQKAFALAWGILALPTYWVGKQIAGYLYAEDWVYVGIADPGDKEIYDVKKVPPDVWKDKTVHGASPLRPDEGVDAVVVRWKWYDELGELEVRGVPKEDMSPAEALKFESRVDTYYEHHQSVRRAYARLKGTVSDRVTTVHDQTLMQMAEQRENADLVAGTSIVDEIKDIEEQIEDVPTGPKGERPEQVAVEETIADVRDNELGEISADLGDLADDQDPMTND